MKQYLISSIYLDINFSILNSFFVFLFFSPITSNSNTCSFALGHELIFIAPESEALLCKALYKFIVDISFLKELEI